MDRKGIIAVTIALATLLVWQYYAAKQMPARLPVPPASAAPAAPTPVAVTTPIAPAQPAEVPLTPTTVDFKTPSVEYHFSSLGGGISSAKLLGHTGEQGEQVVLNEAGKLPIGALSQVPGQAALVPYSVSADQAKGEVTFERTTADNLKITKRFILPSSAANKDQYLVKLEVGFTNFGSQPLAWPGYYLHVGSAAPIHEQDMPLYTAFTYMDKGKAHFTDVNWFSASRIPVLGIQTRPERQAFEQSLEKGSWAGVKNQYFTSLLSPVDTQGTGVWARRFEVPTQEKPLLAIEGALGMPSFTLAAGQNLTQHFELYIGPKEFQMLKQLGGDKDRIMNFGMFRIVSETLLSSMNWLHKHLGNYAAAIVVLTLLIKSALWPLQNKATSSMKQMQLLQPRMTELREKYKDDPTRMNQELMKLYKDYGVNPFSGCLPMLVQIPIFFGFYSMLGTAVELRNSTFLWVKDLSQPDTVMHLAGVPLNVLPLLMAATMLWQMSLTPKSGDKMQQRIFMFMPLIFIVFCYNFASALSLYWTAQNLFSIVQLYLTRDKQVAAPVKVTAAKKKR